MCTTIDQAHGLELLHFELLDTRGVMIVPHNLIAHIETKLVVGQGVCITVFKFSTKIEYYHGDYDCILFLHVTSTLEKIQLAFK